MRKKYDPEVLTVATLIFSILDFIVMNICSSHYCEVFQEDDDASNNSKSLTNSTWNSILAATSSDSKQLDKFKRCALLFFLAKFFVIKT